MVLAFVILLIVAVVVTAAATIEVVGRLEARQVRGFSSPEAYWHHYLTEPPSALTHRAGRLYLRLRPSFEYCRNCFSPFSGVAHQALRVVGHGASPHNPKVCARCMRHLPFGGAEVEISVLFADVRGSVTLAEQRSAREYSAIVNRFYECALRPLVRHDALVDKLVGDEVMALFVPAFGGPNHAERAILAGLEILRATTPDLPIGIGVHTGTAFVGLVGSPEAATDLTALGDAVNVAARLAESAGPGELLCSDVTAAEAAAVASSGDRLVIPVRGRAAPLVGFSMRVPSR